MAFDTRIYLGRPGALAAIRSPRGTFEATRTRRTSSFELGVGGVAVDQMIGGARTYTIGYDQLTREDWGTLQAYLDGHEGPGPFALLDPGQRNMLPANVAAATSVTNTADSIRPVGGFELLGIRDSFNGAAVASGWNGTYTGQTWSVLGGTVANYSKTGTYGAMALTTTNVERTARLSNVGPDVDITVYVTFAPTSPMTGAQAELKVRVRHNGSSYYETNVQYQTSGVVDLYLNRGVTVVNAIGSFKTYNASTVFGIHMKVTGAVIQQKVWDATGGAAEPTAWTYETTDYSLLGNATDSVYLAADRVTGNTNSSLTALWQNLTIAAPVGALSSSTDYTDAGPRSLLMNCSPAPTGGIADGSFAIGIDWPSTTFGYGVPVVAGRSICFSGYVRGGGSDPITTWTPRLLWKTATGSVISATSGTPVASSSSAWTQWYVTGTPPAGTIYADMMINYTSGALSTAQAYFRRLMLNEGSTPDTTWMPGTGVWPVRMTSGADAWPFVSPELRTGPVVVFAEDVS